MRSHLGSTWELQGWVLRRCLSTVNRINGRKYRPKDPEIRALSAACGVTWPEPEPKSSPRSSRNDDDDDDDAYLYEEGSESELDNESDPELEEEAATGRIYLKKRCLATWDQFSLLQVIYFQLATRWKTGSWEDCWSCRATSDWGSRHWEVTGGFGITDLGARANHPSTQRREMKWYAERIISDDMIMQIYQILCSIDISFHMICEELWLLTLRLWIHHNIEQYLVLCIVPFYNVSVIVLDASGWSEAATYWATDESTGQTSRAEEAPGASSTEIQTSPMEGRPFQRH